MTCEHTRDELDALLAEQLVPEGCIPTGSISITTFFDAEGDLFWVWRTSMEAPTSTHVGILEIVKQQMISGGTSS